MGDRYRKLRQFFNIVGTANRRVPYEALDKCEIFLFIDDGSGFQAVEKFAMWHYAVEEKKEFCVILKPGLSIPADWPIPEKFAIRFLDDLNDEDQILKLLNEMQEEHLNKQSRP